MSNNKGCLLGLLDLIFKPKKKEKPASTKTNKPEVYIYPQYGTPIIPPEPASTKKPEAYIYPQYGTPILTPEQTQYQQMPAQQYQQM